MTIVVLRSDSEYWRLIHREMVIGRSEYGQEAEYYICSLEIHENNPRKELYKVVVAKFRKYIL